jgi:hypothetical protein
MSKKPVFKSSTVSNEDAEALILGGVSRRAFMAQGGTQSQFEYVRTQLIQRGMDEGNTEGNTQRMAPPGYIVKGKSTLYNGAEQVMQWVKTDVDKEYFHKVMLEAVRDLVKELPQAAKTKPPKKAMVMEELCTVYTLTDCHIGMLAWGQEGGADWDIPIATETLIGAFREMMRQSPASQTAIINQLGDWLHYDSLTAVTPTSKHALDAAGRPAQMVKAAIYILKTIIDDALDQHGVVHVIVAEGNHDMYSSLWLREIIIHLYANEPRVVVNDSQIPFYTIQHGNVFLGFTHGHKRKASDLPLLFASNFAKQWGDTKFRYAHIGHMHHVDIKEYDGMIVTQHPTLAARDAYSSHLGFSSLRSATSITYHADYGQVGTVSVSPEMLKLKGEK